MLENEDQPQKSSNTDDAFSHIFTDKICGCCGKAFCRIDWISYAYKIRTKMSYIYFCSWTCLQKYRAELEAKHPKKSLAVATDAEANKKKKGTTVYIKKRRTENH